MVYSKKIPSNFKALPKFISDSINEISKLPFSDGQIHDIRLALEEALVNAIRHGNKHNPDLPVEVSMEVKRGSLIITVADQGKGFDFQHIPDPTKPDNLQKLSGRGIFLIRNRMDKVDFLDSGRKVKMTKFFKKGEKS